jgi:lysophospholipase L1-like esterase
MGSKLGRPVAALLLLLYALAFGEVYLRLFGSRLFGDRGRSYLRQPYQYTPVHKVPFRTNGLGLRGEDFRKGVLRVVAFGGSATESGDVPEAESWPARLEAHLNARAPFFQVVNAGVSGLASAHYLAHLEELSAPLGIDVAIIYTGTNDADRLARYKRIIRVEQIDDPTYGEAFLQAFHRPDPARLEETLSGHFLKRSRLLLFLRDFAVKSFIQPGLRRLEDLLPGQTLAEKRIRLRALPEYESILSRARKDYTHNLTLMIEVSRRHRVTPIFATTPLASGDPDSELQVLNQALVSLCRKRGAALVDLASEKPPQASGWHRRSSHHFTRKSADRAGALIADEIFQLLEPGNRKGKTLQARARSRGLRLVAAGQPGAPRGTPPEASGSNP